MNRRDMILSAGMAALSTAVFPMRWVGASERKKQKVLYFTRTVGYEHDIVRRKGDELGHAEKALVAMGKGVGIDVECTKDGRVFDGDLTQYDAFVFSATGDQTLPNKRNVPPMSPTGKAKFLDAVAAGKGFVGVHNACGSWLSKGPQYENQDQVDPYIAMLGGEFVVHGVPQEASLRLVSPGFPGTEKLDKELRLRDEWYSLKNLAKDMHVILVQETHGMRGECYQRPPFPATWARQHHKGRVFYTSMGHFEDIWTNAHFQDVLLGGLTWAMGNVDADVTPNFDKVTPKAHQIHG